MYDFAKEIYLGCVRVNRLYFLVPALLFVLSAALIASLSVVMERTQTLKRVREVDHQLVQSLLRASIGGEFSGAERVTHLQKAVSLLGGTSLSSTRIPMEIFHEKTLVATNIAPYAISAVMSHFKGPPETVVHTNVGDGWQLVSVLPDRKYDFEAWHAPISVPLQQLSDQRDVSLSLFVRKAKLPFILVTATGLVLIGILSLYARWSEARLSGVETKLKEAIDRVEQTKGQRDALEALTAGVIKEIEASKLKLQELETAHETSVGELEAVRRAGSMHVREAELLEQTVLSYVGQLHAMQGKVAELEREKAKGEADLEVAMAWIDANEKEASQLQSKLDASFRPQSESARTAQIKLIEQLWDLEWHRDALDEAVKLLRVGQAAERKQLSELLHEVATLKSHDSPGSKWSPFKGREKHGWIWHNGGRQQTKIYWTSNGPRRAVLAIAKGGDDHEKYDGGDRLFQRLQGLRTQIARAA